MKIRLSLILLLLIPFAAVSQKVSIAIGSGLLQHRQQSINSSVYSGNQFNIFASYSSKEKKQRRFIINGNATASMSAWNKTNNELFQLAGNLEAAYLKKINSFFCIGPTAKSRYQLNRYSLDYGHPFWFTQYSLGVYNEFLYPLKNKIQLNASLSIPLIGFFSSTPEQSLYTFKNDYTKAYYNSNLKLNSLNKFQAATFTCGVTKPLRKKISLSINYVFDWFNYTQISPISNLNHQLRVGIQMNYNDKK